jgi:uncharacterized protein YdeI (YjbR/CyaY-like superfamily)
MKRAATADEFYDGLDLWREEAARLRSLVLSCGAEETVKWGGPVYTAQGRNVVGVVAFKSYFGLWFFDGARLDDKEGVLINAQEGKTKAMRQWRMTAAKDIRPALVKAYVKEAIRLAAG